MKQPTKQQLRDSLKAAKYWHQEALDDVARYKKRAWLAEVVAYACLATIFGIMLLEVVL